MWSLKEPKEPKEVFKLLGHIKNMCICNLSLHEKLIASGGFDGTLHIWNLERQKDFCILSGHASSVLSVCISQDGEYLQAGLMIQY